MEPQLTLMPLLVMSIDKRPEGVVVVVFEVFVMVVVFVVVVVVAASSGIGNWRLHLEDKLALLHSGSTPVVSLQVSRTKT
jgi:hypothetical protein